LTSAFFFAPAFDPSGLDFLPAFVFFFAVPAGLFFSYLLI
jgi:hypothetical protein